MRGASAKYGCRRCWNEGHLINNLYYYPHLRADPPLDLFNLQERENFAEVSRTIGASRHEEILKEAGINGKSPLVDLPRESVFFTRAVPYGIMHLIPIGIVEKIGAIWAGEFGFDNALPGCDDWTLPPWNLREYLPDMGLELATASNYLPANLGDAPLNFETRRNEYTAHQWQMYLRLYSIPLVMGRLPEAYINH